MRRLTKNKPSVYAAQSAICKTVEATVEVSSILRKTSTAKEQLT